MILRAACIAVALAQTDAAAAAAGCVRLAEAVIVMETEARRAASGSAAARPDGVVALARGLHGVVCARDAAEALFAGSPLAIPALSNGPNLDLALCAAQFWFGVSLDAAGAVDLAWAGAPKSLDGACPHG